MTDPQQAHLQFAQAILQPKIAKELAAPVCTKERKKFSKMLLARLKKGQKQ